MDQEKVLQFIPPEKDIDGLHTHNIGSLAMKNHSPYFVSCTPLGCLTLILKALEDIHKNETNPDIWNPARPLEGRNVCIIGRSNIVGMPLSLLLMQKYDANVFICHTKTPQQTLAEQVAKSEIVITCCG